MSMPTRLQRFVCRFYYFRTQVTPPGSRVVRPTCPAPISAHQWHAHVACAPCSHVLVYVTPPCRSQVALRVMMLSQSSLPRRRSSATLERQVDTSTVEVPFSRLLGQLGKEITLACACARPLWLRATPGGLRARNGTAGRDRLPWLRNRPLFGGRRAEAPSSREHLRRAERRWLRRRWGG